MDSDREQIWSPQQDNEDNDDNISAVNSTLNSSSNLSTLNNEANDNKRFSKLRIKTMLVIALLFFLNLINYVDRFTVAGVLTQIQKYFEIDNASGGLLQTVFICSYMLLAPLFGYLGDRYNRKYLIICGIFFWSLMTLLGSFVPSDRFWIFVVIRSLVGIGEASYSCIAPTIIGDLFTEEMRTHMLAVFYIAIPVGSGLGYIIGSNIATAFGDWRWALRFTPPLGIISILLLIILVEEPKRGGAEGQVMATGEKTSFLSDVKYLIKHKSFMWVTLGFTFGTFVMGGLSWWVPTFIEYAIQSNNKKPEQIALMFGLITVLSGLLGVSISTALAPKLRKKSSQADPIICASGSLIAVPCLFLAILLPRMVPLALLWFIIGVGITVMCLCWTLVADILLYTVHPNKRSIASALNILISHILGDAISPYILGAISDKLRQGMPDTYLNRFNSLQAALYAGPFFAALSFGAYLVAALFVKKDKDEVEAYIKKKKQEYAAQNGNAQKLDESEDIESSTKIENSTNDITTATSTAAVTPTSVNTNSKNGYTNINYNHSNSNTRANLANEVSDL